MSSKVPTESESSVSTCEATESGPQHDTRRTGFFKPLPITGKAARLWSSLGLFAGQRLARVVRDDHVFLLLMAVLVGVTAGGAAGLLLLWIDRARGLFPDAHDPDSIVWVALLLAPVVGGLLVGALRVLLHQRRSNFVGGIPSVLVAVADPRRGLEARDTGIVGLGAGLTIASGGSVGHEGPTVAIGATVGSLVARFFGLRQRRQLAMLGAGCAAGLAAAFNAPLAGVIFTVEVIFKRNVQENVGGMSVFTPLIVAAVSGTFTSYMIFGERTEFAEHVANDGISVIGMTFVLLLAICAGLLSPIMSSAILLSRDLFTRLQVPRWLKPALGGLGLGLIGLSAFVDPSFSELLGPGREIVSVALQDNLSWKLALALLILKIFATALTIGSGGMGGVFMPSLFIGACLGTVVHVFAEAVFGPSIGSAGAYALVGMGAYLGATLRAPLTPIVMIFEFTHDYGLILPLMLACILSAFVATRSSPLTLFERMLDQAGVTLTKAQQDVEIMSQGSVTDLMSAVSGVIAIDATGREVRDACLGQDGPILYVEDTQGRICGALELREVANRVISGTFDDESPVSDLMLPQDPVVLFRDDSLAGAMSAFSRAEREILPVVDQQRKIVGLLRRGDLIAHYNRKILQTQDSELQISGGQHGPDQEVGLGAGVVLERVVVGPMWAGKSLAELDLRGRFQVQVLEWSRAHELLVIDPQVPLHEADTLALAGTRERLLDARASSSPSLT